MKLNITRPAMIEVTAIRFVLPVDYGDEDMPLNFPRRRAFFGTKD